MNGDLALVRLGRSKRRGMHNIRPIDVLFDDEDSRIGDVAVYIVLRSCSRSRPHSRACAAPRRAAW